MNVSRFSVCGNGLQHKYASMQGERMKQKEIEKQKKCV